jgi:hypothetical protein
MEEYKKIIGYDNYECSNLGNIKNSKTSRILKKYLCTNGYLAVCLKNEKIRIHRLIGKTFLDNPDNFLIIDHIDRDKTNNNINNLRWCSYKTNSINKKVKYNAVSQYKGIDYDKIKKTWKPYIYINGKVKRLGSFKTEKQAYETKCLYITDNELDKNLLG